MWTCDHGTILAHTFGHSLIFTGFVTPLLCFIIKDSFYIKQKPITTIIKVWLDTNGNGEREVDEPSLSDICVWAGVLQDFKFWAVGKKL